MDTRQLTTQMADDETVFPTSKLPVLFVPWIAYWRDFTGCTFNQSLRKPYQVKKKTDMFKAI